MFRARLIGKVRKELNNLNFSKDGEIEIIKIKENSCLLRFENDECSYVVYYYEQGHVKEKIDKQFILEKYGIETGIISYSDYIVVCKDYENHVGYRRAILSDVNNEKFVRSLAKWYKKLHSIKNENIVDFCDFFTLKNIKLLVTKLNLKENRFIKYVMDNFDNIKGKVSKVDKCMIVGRFSFEDIIVSKDNNLVFVSNLENLSNGFAFVDIDFVLEIIGKNHKDKFMEEYGNFNEDEIVINKVVGCVVNLYIASKSEIFPKWAKVYLNMINSEDLVNSAITLVEWC